MKDNIKSVLFGIAVGDALGVPVEFMSREQVQRNPVTDMREYGTHDQPAGTFSDDTSLAFCLAEALTVGNDLNVVARNFIRWYREGYWTAHGNVFDIGIATRQAIERLIKGEKPELAGGYEENSNGNGSLMRILPLVFYIKDKDIDDRWEATKKVSSITHMHIRSVIACFYYLEFSRQLIIKKDKFEAYANTGNIVSDYLIQRDINKEEVNLFSRLLYKDIWHEPEYSIDSTGYVLHTLEASVWCIMTTDNFSQSVLKAVNLGDDTDTTGAVTGGLAGLLHGYDDIPDKWIKTLSCKINIDDLVKRFYKKLYK